MKILKYLFLVSIIASFCCAKNISASANKSPLAFNAEKPNIIFYLADDQNQLDYGCYGNPKVKTSNVDKLAEEGIRFTNFYTAQAICAPSRSQIYTGKYPLKNGCMGNHLPVKRSLSSITTYLKNAGYEVVLAGKSHVKPNNVFDWTHYFPPVETVKLPLDSIDSYLKNAKQPFCLILASDYPHGPYPKTDKYTQADIHPMPYDKGKIPTFKTGYYQNIEYDNIQLGKVLNMVDAYNLKDKTMFIYASDHGISGKFSVTEEGLRVPFIVRWPGHVTPKSTSNTLLTFVDVLPTFLEAVNAKMPEDIDGKSFLKTIKGNKEEIHEYIYGITTNQNIQDCKIFPSRMVRGQRFKFIRNYNSIEVYKSNFGDNPIVNEFIKIGALSYPNTPYEELYDLSVDPYQKNNLAKKAEYKQEKEKLIKELAQWMTSQNDFLLTHKMPLIKPTQNPLDKQSQWNKVPKELEGKLKEDD